MASSLPFRAEPKLNAPSRRHQAKRTDVYTTGPARRRAVLVRPGMGAVKQEVGRNASTDLAAKGAEAAGACAGACGDSASVAGLVGRVAARRGPGGFGGLA